MTLREVFVQAKRRTLPGAWLCLPDSPWTLETEGAFADCESALPRSSNGRELKETLDDGTIEQVVDWADRLSGGPNEAARLEVFNYYYRFDAFPEALGAPEPPSPKEIMHKLDLQFYNHLSFEEPGTKCRKDGCQRGATRFSVFCRIHHFEKVKKKPCPFEH